MRAANGFTLIELLVAMVAASLLLTGLGWALGGLRFDLARSAPDPAVAQLEAFQTPFRHLVAAMEPPASLPGGQAFSESEARFASVAPQAFPAGPVRVTLQVVPARDGKTLQLILSRTDRNAPLYSGEPLTGFAQISFATIAARPPDAARSPRLVMIETVDKKGTVRTLAAPSRLVGSGGCRFDPVSMACRP